MTPKSIPKEMDLHILSENIEFVFWSKAHGFLCLSDYFQFKLADLLNLEGFTKRIYKELIDLTVKFGYEEYFADFD